MKYLLVLLLLIVPLRGWALSDGITITTLDIVDKASITTNNYPLSFGHVFKQGDVPSGKFVKVKIGSTEYDTQCENITYWADGSIRFATISTVVPVFANETTTLTLFVSSFINNTGEMDKSAILATNIESFVKLTHENQYTWWDSTDRYSKGKVVRDATYFYTSLKDNNNALLSDTFSWLQGEVVPVDSVTPLPVADLNQAIVNSATLDYWRKGSVTTEILVRGDIDNRLNAYWEVQFFPTTPFGIRLSTSVENMNASHRSFIVADVEIESGTPILSQIYQQDHVQHHLMSRWRRVDWIGAKPPEIQIKYNLNYLISTKMIPNYDQTLELNSTRLFDVYEGFLENNNNLGGRGSFNWTWSATGLWWYLAPIDGNSVIYLLTMDNRFREMSISASQTIASSAYHWRESDISKNNYGKYISIDDRPTIWTTLARCRDGADGINEVQLNNAAATNAWSIDRSHSQGVSYIPYIITGDKFHLEELQYRAANSLSMSDGGTCAWCRDKSTGLIIDQTRGVAWTVRDIAYASILSPDSADYNYFDTKLNANLAQWATDEKKDKYPLKYWKNSCTTVPDGLKSEVKCPTSPWMDDYLLSILGIVGELGYQTSDIIEWFSSFAIGRMTNPDFNKYNAPAYRFPSELDVGGYVQTWAEASSLYINQPTTYPDQSYQSISKKYSGNRYTTILKSALSFATQVTGGQAAYDIAASELMPNDTIGYSENAPLWNILSRELAMCSNLYLDLCTDSTSCLIVGGYFCNDVCQNIQCPTIRADVNQDSQISTMDAMLIQRNSLGLDMTETSWKASATTGDANCDSSSNAIDAVLLLRYSLGLFIVGANWCE